MLKNILVLFDACVLISLYIFFGRTWMSPKIQFCKMLMSRLSVVLMVVELQIKFCAWCQIYRSVMFVKFDILLIKLFLQD